MYENFFVLKLLLLRKTWPVSPFRSSRQVVLLGKGALIVCSKFTEDTHAKNTHAEVRFQQSCKQLYWSHTSAWVFSSKFAAYFQNTFSSEHILTAVSVPWTQRYEKHFKLMRVNIKKILSIHLQTTIINTG